MQIVIEKATREISGYGIGITAGDHEEVMESPEGFDPDWVRTRTVNWKGKKLVIGESANPPVNARTLNPPQPLIDEN